MSADNELVLAEFNDIIIVKMQFASYFWFIDEESETYDDDIRQAFMGGRVFEKLADAETWVANETINHYYEYGDSYIRYDFNFSKTE